MHDILQRLIDLFSDTAAEGKMAIFDDQFQAYLKYDRDHYMCHIRLEYVCSLNPKSCALMTDSLVQKIIKAGLDDLPIICSFTNIRHRPSDVAEQPAKEKTFTLEEYSKLTSLSTDQLLKLVKPSFIRIAIPNE